MDNTMLKSALLGCLASLLAAGSVAAQSCASYPNTLTNGTTADASQVTANFNCAALLGNARFTSSVGIGTTTPNALLSLGNAITTIKLAAFDNGAGALYGIGVNSGELTFGANIAATATPQMVLSSAGNLGVGSTSPSALLSLGAAVTTIKLAAYDSGGGSSNLYGMGVNAGLLTFGAGIAASGAPQMVLAANGSLGIGTTTPAQSLTVNGNADVMANGAYLTEIPNASSTGTTANKLAKLTGAPSTAVLAATTDTDGIIGVVAGGAGTTGNAQIAISGQASCVFENATTAGDFVSIGSSTAGDCHDAGATRPGSGQTLGRVLATVTAGSSAEVLLYIR
jgi:hypothetical protein